MKCSETGCKEKAEYISECDLILRESPSKTVPHPKNILCRVVFGFCKNHEFKSHTFTIDDKNNYQRIHPKEFATGYARMVCDL
tara:strand:- start:731 stop:979 length:249 start_codon:yes stop_codon:yes gene_type:complete